MASAGAKAERAQAPQRWLVAAELFEHDVPEAGTARRLGVPRQAVFTWRHRWSADRVDGLRGKRPPGFPEWLSPEQRGGRLTPANN